MIIASQLRPGTVLKVGQDLLKVVESSSQVGQGKMPGSVHAKLRNIHQGTYKELRWRPEDRLEDVELEKQEMEFLYADADSGVFMNPVTFEQVSIPLPAIGPAASYLKPEMKLSVEFYQGEPVNIGFPAIVEMRIESTAAPSAAGQHAQAGHFGKRGRGHGAAIHQEWRPGEGGSGNGPIRRPGANGRQETLMSLEAGAGCLKCRLITLPHRQRYTLLSGFPDPGVCPEQPAVGIERTIEAALVEQNQVWIVPGAVKLKARPFVPRAHKAVVPGPPVNVQFHRLSVGAGADMPWQVAPDSYLVVFAARRTQFAPPGHAGTARVDGRTSPARRVIRLKPDVESVIAARG